MSRITTSVWIAIPLLLGVTLATAAMHGVASNRWGPRPSMQAAAARLQKPMPQRIGDWVLRSEEEMVAEHEQTLQCAGYLIHRYEHVESRARINVFVIVGPHGPTAVHTPEICFSTSNHTAQGEARVAAIQDASGEKHELWDLTFKANNLDASDQRVLYAWSVGGPWQATRHPRFAHAGAPYLYKIQLSGPPKAEGATFDPCIDFLSSFLAQLAQRLAEPASTLPDAS